MSHRCLVALSALVAVIMVASLRSTPAAGQAPTATAKDAAVAKTWTPPRTPWGDPDLQGVWTTDEEVSVPLERPVEFGERAFLTDDELAERAEREERQARDDKADRRTRPGDPGAGPEHWYEQGDRPSRRTSLIVDPPNGRLPPLTPEAQNRVIDPSTVLGFVSGVGSMGDGPFNGPEDFHLADRCITRGLPQTWFPSAYNNGFEIVQGREYMVILYERLHEHRIIPLGGRSPLPSAIRQWIGDSRGRWEGDTLVVDVTNFSDRTSFRRSGENLHLVERYTRVAPDTVRVEVTIEDPTTWTRPWTVAVTGKKDPEYSVIYEYACHEGNYGMKHILSAARAKEKAGEEAAKAKQK